MPPVLFKTYGGRNSPAQITHDAMDLRAAAERNFAALVPALKAHGVTEEQLEQARARLHQLNEKEGFYQP